MLTGFGSPVAQPEQWDEESRGPHGGLGGLRLVLGQVQVVDMAAIQWLSPRGTPAAWSDHRVAGGKHILHDTLGLEFAALSPIRV